MADDLRVDLAAFHGPLDLLLHLVQQAEVDVHDIPVAQIADQFVKHVQQGLGALDVDQAGEFLVMASHLLVLKSRALLPRDTPLDEEEILALPCASVCQGKTWQRNRRDFRR